MSSVAASGLHHVALGANDVERVAAFYREVFELSESARHSHPDTGVLRSVWLDLGGPLLMIEHTPQPPRKPEGIAAGPFLLAFRVTLSDRQRLETLLETRGHPIEARTDFTSYTRDPEGNRVAFSHYPERRSQP